MTVVVVKNESGIKRALRDNLVSEIKIEGQPLKLIPRKCRSIATWYVYFYSKGKKQRSIGRYPEFSLSDAVILKTSVANELMTSKKKSDNTRFKTVGELLSWFSDGLNKKKKHRRLSIESAIKNHLLPSFGHFRIDELRKEHIYDFFRHQEESDCKPSSTKLRFFVLKQAFIQASKIDLIESNLFLKTKVTDFTELRSKARESRLKKRHIEKAITAINEQKNIQLKLFNMVCMMFGTRLNETRLIKWSELNFEDGELTLLAENTKNGDEHVLPITKKAMNLIRLYKEKQKRSYRGDYVFNSGKSCISESKAKHYVKIVSDSAGFKWSCHDYRKLVKSMMTDLRVTDFISERIVNHRMNSIQQAYTQGEMKSLMLDALNVWHDYIDKIEEKRKWEKIQKK